jgi:hypothetical protein
MYTPINDDFLKSFAVGTLEIHCSHIKLRQNLDHGAKEFNGPGVITLAPDREAFAIRLYSEVHDPLLAFNMFTDDPAGVEPGVILPPEVFYSLEASSIEGHVWTFPRVRIEPHSGAGGTMIIGRCPQLLTKAEPARTHEGEVLHLVSFSDLDIPLNRVIERKATSGDKVLSQSVTRARAEFVHAGVEFEFEKLEEPSSSTELICRSTVPLPVAFAQRVQETLRLMTFSPVSWAVSQQNLRGVVTVVLSATATLPSGILPPPIPAVQAPEDFWRLFTCYLDHVCRHTDPKTVHPSERWPQAALEFAEASGRSGCAGDGGGS